LGALGTFFCGHEPGVDIDDWPDDATVAVLRPAHAL
jgi:hypothetical protein